MVEPGVWHRQRRREGAPAGPRPPGVLQGSRVGRPPPIAARKACALAERAGDTTWRFVSRVAQGYESGKEFTFEGLRYVFSVTVESVKSWHRNMARTAKSIDEEMGTEPRFFEARWDGARQHYWLTDVMREALLAADVERRANRL